jgi:hypothetical protein
MEPLSPELVLVSSPEEAAAARASLELPPPAPTRSPVRRTTLATLYTACVTLTATPVTLLAVLHHPH